MTATVEVKPKFEGAPVNWFRFLALRVMGGGLQ